MKIVYSNRKLFSLGFSVMAFFRHVVTDLLFCMLSLGLRRVQLLKCVHLIF